MDVACFLEHDQSLLFNGTIAPSRNSRSSSACRSAICRASDEYKALIRVNYQTQYLPLVPANSQRDQSGRYLASGLEGLLQTLDLPSAL